ncbi:MAG: redox-regulated ATPase YchF [Propionibacteriaceae bacterium]|nr:redox-regulated ATPase YchF [Propionibacteriaceae bacterium]
MALTIGIVGLPNSGKSTMFNALTRNNVLAAKYRFATIEANVGIVGVPDPRLKVLAEMHNSEKIIPATVSFVDIAGIVKGASSGEGMGNAFLASIREADAICQVTRCFADDDVTAMEGEVNPASDIDTITTELILTDLQTIEKAKPRLEKDMRLKKETQSTMDAWLEAEAVLSDGKTVYSAGLDLEPLRDLWLLTAKPFIYVFNCDQDALADEQALATMREIVAPAEAIFLDAAFEAEVVAMDEDEGRQFLAEMGVEEPGLDKLARVGYETLGLQSFLTAGEKEVRAWTIKQGWTAPFAAGVIHTDFQKKFIKAEVVSYEDLIELGSMAAVRTAGKARIEGKDYVMQPSDVVEFRHG